MSDLPLGIIIPVYNEAANIGSTLAAIEDKIRIPHRIYIVYDFDEDNTLPVVRGFLEKGLDLKFIKNPERGVVNAIKTGLKSAEEDYLLVTMADLSDDYTVVDEMYKLMTEGYDVVCGSRYMKGGRQVGGPLLKKTISRIADVSLRYIAGLPTHDATNSFKLYRRTMLGSIEIKSDGGFEIGMEIVVKAHFGGFRVTEVPCVWMDREKGESRFKILKWAPKYLRWYFYAMEKRFNKKI
jgi:glycosyltransferase involved in cell wall biosynthesis